MYIKIPPKSQKMATQLHTHFRQVLVLGSGVGLRRLSHVDGSPLKTAIDGTSYQRCMAALEVHLTLAVEKHNLQRSNQPKLQAVRESRWCILVALCCTPVES